ncbi:MAG: hypothetical protein IJV40_00345 [Oscillospiraceae bacterium]|nr:hypothetical protein [Oscillospiraceae bacterium]
MKIRSLIPALIVCFMLLCGCASANGAETRSESGQKSLTAAEADSGAAESLEQSVETEQAEATPVPVRTPAPIPEIRFPDGSMHKLPERRVNLSSLTHGEVEAYAEVLSQMPKLRYVNLGEEGSEEQPRDLSWTDIRRLQEACPDTDFCYGFTLFGKRFTTLDEEMNFHHIEMDDEGAAVREVLPCMTKCRLLDMDFSGVSSEAMAGIRDDYPGIKVVWRIWFGTNCSVRTDVERILASNLDHKLQDTNTQDLKYCTEVRLLDIGHNEMLTDFSFLEYMPDLEVAILGISGMRDFHSLAGCTKLEYLELNTLYWNQDPDLSPLKDLTNLEHLNLCRLGHLQHWEVLKNMTGLKRLYFGCFTYVPEGAKEELERIFPDTEIDWKTPTGCDDGWRFDGHGGYVERYQLLREQFEYSNYTNVSSAWWNDPMYYKEGEPRYRPSDWW